MHQFELTDPVHTKAITYVWKSHFIHYHTVFMYVCIVQRQMHFDICRDQLFMH